MKLLILNGPNLNMLGIREPGFYGATNYVDLVAKIQDYGEQLNVEMEFYQSNSEGALIDKLQEAYFKNIDGIVFNPGAYTHTSIALLDALLSISIPTVEVHISNINNREAFRQKSYIRSACIHHIIGEGLEGYKLAIDYLIDYLEEQDDS